MQKLEDVSFTKSPMIKRYFDKSILSPEMFKPSNPAFEIIGVFNPGVCVVNNEVWMLVRIAERPKKKIPGAKASPRIIPKSLTLKYDVDYIDEKTSSEPDQGCIIPDKGSIRLTHISHFKLVKLQDFYKPTYIQTTPAFYPKYYFESYGVEDARITQFGDTYYFTYVAVSPNGVKTALASTKDFKTFKRLGIIFPIENKDVVILPEQVDGKYIAFHRPVARNEYQPPEMWIAYSPDLLHWGRHHFLIGKDDPLSLRIGAGAPPIRIKEGFLAIYHIVYVRSDKNPVGKYCVGAALFDANNAGRLIAKTSRPILVPEKQWEMSGYVSKVIFPTGVVRDNDYLWIYSGTADRYISAIQVKLQDILDRLSENMNS